MDEQKDGLIKKINDLLDRIPFISKDETIRKIQLSIAAGGIIASIFAAYLGITQIKKDNVVKENKNYNIEYYSPDENKCKCKDISFLERKIRVCEGDKIVITAYLDDIDLKKAFDGKYDSPTDYARIALIASKTGELIKKMRGTGLDIEVEVYYGGFPQIGDGGFLVNSRNISDTGIGNMEDGLSRLIKRSNRRINFIPQNFLMKIPENYKEANSVICFAHKKFGDGIYDVIKKYEKQGITLNIVDVSGKEDLKKQIEDIKKKYPDAPVNYICVGYNYLFPDQHAVELTNKHGFNIPERGLGDPIEY